MALEQIGLEAVLKDANFQAGLARYNQGVKAMESVTASGANTISRIGALLGGALVVGAGLAVAALGAVSAAMKIGLDATMAWGEQLDKLGDLFGMTGEEASTMAVAMGRVGLTVDEGAMGLNNFTRQMDDFGAAVAKGDKTISPFGKALDSLGVSAFDAQGNLKTFNVIMPQIMDAFSKLPAGVKASALAMDLFGARGGSKFLDFLRQGSAGMKDSSALAESLGLVLSTDAVNAVEQFGFSLSILGLGFEGIKTQLGLAVLPLVQELVNVLVTRVIPAFVSWERGNLPRLVETLRAFGNVLGSFFNYLQLGTGPLVAFTAVLRDFFGTGQEAVFWAFRLQEAFKARDWGAIAARLGDLAGALAGWFQGQIAAANLGSIPQAIADRLAQFTQADWTNAVTAIGNSLGAALGAIRIGAEALGGFAQSVGDALGSALGGGGGGGYGAGTKTTTWVDRFAAAVGGAIKGIKWEDAVTWFAALDAQLGKAFQALGDAVGVAFAAAVKGSIESQMTIDGPAIAKFIMDMDWLGPDFKRWAENFVNAWMAGGPQPPPGSLLVPPVPTPPTGAPAVPFQPGFAPGEHLPIGPGFVNAPSGIGGGAGTASPLVDQLVTALSDPANGVRVITALGAALASVTAQAAMLGQQIAKPLTEGLINGMAAAGPPLAAQMNVLITIIRNAFAGMYQIGVNAMNALIAGIQSRGMAVAMAIVGIIQHAISLVKEMLGIASPSKVFAGIGENMALGLAQGWAGGIAMGLPQARLTAQQPTVSIQTSGGGGSYFSNYGSISVNANDPMEFQRRLIAQLRVG